jgi:hypothetical protein
MAKGQYNQSVIRSTAANRISQLSDLALQIRSSLREPPKSGIVTDLGPMIILSLTSFFTRIATHSFVGSLGESVDNKF